jgi:hypothetical protein
VLSVAGARVSALQRDRTGARTLRLVNLSEDDGSVEATWADAPVGRATVVDLTGNVVAPVDGPIDLRPWEIVTIRSDPPPA